MKMSTDDLLEQFKEMTLLELPEFIKQFEETFDVTAAAAAPVMMAAPGGAGGGESRSRGAGRVRRGSHRRRRQEDPGDPGGARADEPGPQGGQGSRRRRLSPFSKVNKEAADAAKEALEGAGASVEVKPQPFCPLAERRAGSDRAPPLSFRRDASFRLESRSAPYAKVPFAGTEEHGHGGGTRRHAVRRRGTALRKPFA